MRVWTFQPVSAYQELMSNGVYRCDITKSDLFEEYDAFRRAYNWMSKQMEQRIGKAEFAKDSKERVYPVWVWYKWNNKNVRPDLRYTEFRHRETAEYLLELEIPDNEIVLSDFDDWHFVLNGVPLDDGDDGDDIFMTQSWESIFDNMHDYVQGSIWQIKKEYLVKAKYCQARPEVWE